MIGRSSNADLGSFGLNRGPCRRSIGLNDVAHNGDIVGASGGFERCFCRQHFNLVLVDVVRYIVAVAGCQREEASHSKYGLE